MQKISQSLLKKYFTYDQYTGYFRWRRCSKPAYVGRIAGGYDNPAGYYTLYFNGVKYLAHRLAWLYHYGVMPTIIDHRNHAKDDNRIINLRDVSQSENVMNSNVSDRNTTGLKGVSRHKNRFRASIMKEGVVYRIGYYATPEEAHEAYKAKSLELFGEYSIFHGESIIE